MSANNRVVFVTQRFPPDKGGNAARMHDITTNMDDEWDVTVLCPPPSYPPGEFERTTTRRQTETVEDVAVHRLWTYQPQTENPGMARRMAYYLCFGIQAMLWLLWNVRSYDAVVTTTPPISTGAPGLLARVLGKRWIVDVRDLWIDASISLGYLEAGSLVERLSRRFQGLVLRTADRVAVTTELLGQRLADSYGDSLAAKTVLVPNGVDVDQFQPPAAERNAGAPSAQGVVQGGDSPSAAAPGTDATPASVGDVDRSADGPPPTIIYTGNLGAAQDLDSCIRAMSHLSRDATLRLVGAGDMESTLKELSEDLGVTDRVVFEGTVPREEIPSLLRTATIGITPLKSTDELAYAMPTKLYEYMASGLPVLVTGSGEIEQFVADAECGVHVDNDPEQIAAALDDLLASAHRRRRLGANGREHVERSYDRTAIAETLGDELHALLSADGAS
jgi:colanic acid biosynthesis glycosyl transferase WcaI